MISPFLALYDDYEYEYDFYYDTARLDRNGGREFVGSAGGDARLGRGQIGVGPARAPRTGPRLSR